MKSTIEHEATFENNSDVEVKVTAAGLAFWSVAAFSVGNDHKTQ